MAPTTRVVDDRKGGEERGIDGSQEKENIGEREWKTGK